MPVYRQGETNAGGYQAEAAQRNRASSIHIGLSPGQRGQCSPGRTESQRSLLGIHPADPGGWKDKAKWILASKNAPLGGCPEFEVPGAAGVGGSLMPQGHEACWASTPHSSMAMPPASPADGCGRRQMGCCGSRGCLGFPQLLQHVDPDSCLLQGRGLPGSGDPQ